MALEPSPNQSFPLPALDTPLAKILGTLRERAAVGDAGSACRLAAEYAYCSNLPRKLSELERWLAQRQLALKLITDPILHREAEDNIRRELQLRERGLSRVRLHCEGVDQVSPADIAHHWLTAAKSGNLAAMKISPAEMRFDGTVFSMCCLSFPNTGTRPKPWPSKSQKAATRK